MTEELKPCPFCGNDVQMRQALWPHDGNVDAIIHDHPTDCGLLTFSIGRTDEGVSTAAAWNARAPSTKLTQLVKAAQEMEKKANGIMADVSSAQNSRQGASEWMVEDDREFRRDLKAAFEALTAALVPFKEVE